MMARLRRLPLFAVATVAFALILFHSAAPVIPARVSIHISASYPEYSAHDLLSYADAVALITPIGRPTVHWNSSDGQPWASDEMGRRSHIYRDQLVRVDRLLRGSIHQEVVTLRGVGGRIGDVEITYHDAADDLRDGRTYLAFLELVDTPTREGTEAAWALVYLKHGLFEAAGAGEWVNQLGKRTTEQQLTAAQ